MKFELTILALCLLALAIPAAAGDSIDAYLEERSRALGLDPWPTIDRITVPPAFDPTEEVIVLAPTGPSYPPWAQPANPFGHMTDDQRNRLRCLDGCWFADPPLIEQHSHERRR